MTDLLQSSWLATDAAAVKKILAALSSHFLVSRHPAEIQHLVLFDTVDWRLWHAKQLCIREDSRVFSLFQNEQPPVQTEAKQSATRFYWDFPAGDFQNTLKKHIKLRALLTHCTLTLTSTRIDLLNNDEKTVVRLRYLVSAATSGEEQHYFVLQPLRGYQKEYSRAQHILQEHSDLRQCTTSPDLRHLFLQAGAQPKPQAERVFGIKPEEPAEAAVRHMAHTMVARAFEQKQGILDDIDTEFLHDYRVNLRKSRSLITLTKQVFVAEHFRELKQNLSTLAGTTNSLRDLDVLLLSQSDYQSLLPENYQEGLNDLFKEARRDRRNAFRRVCRFLRSAQYGELVAAVNKELDRAPEYASDTAKMPLGELAKGRILRCYKKIRRLSRDIDDSTPDEKVHEVRIECKKIRYLLEFFAELMEATTLNRLLKKLRKLQNILGRFNDYSVQKLFFAAYASPADHSDDMVAAVNGLIAVLHQKQLQERHQVGAALAEFTSPEVAAQFASAFSH